MDYFSLKCFVEVARRGSFSKAADKLFRTQPAISLQIRKLEKELKQPLLDRFKKRISLTEQGKILYEQAGDLLDRLDDVKRLTSKGKTEPQGTLTIATNLCLINNFLPPIIGEFHEKYPHVKLSLLNLKSKDIGASLLEGTADLGIGYLLKGYPEITKIHIKKASFLLVSRKGLAKEIPLKEAFKKPFVHFEAGVDLRSYIEQQLRQELAIILELPSIESLLNYVYQGFGYSIVPDFSLSDYWNGKIAAKQLHNLIPPLDICAYTHKKRILSKATEKFLEILR